MRKLLSIALYFSGTLLLPMLSEAGTLPVQGASGSAYLH